MDEARKAFEAWIVAHTSWATTKTKIGTYRDYDAQISWHAYKAGRLAGFAEAREMAAKLVEDRNIVNASKWNSAEAIRALEPK